MKSSPSDQITKPPDGRPPSEQPRWRQDFPIDWPQDEYISRRDLVKFMVLTSLAFTVGQFWLLIRDRLARKGEDLPEVSIAQVSEIPVGGSKFFFYPEGSTARLLLRLDTDSFVAYDQQCTHLTCPVIPKVEDGHLICPCHNGIFDLATGNPVAGPPRRPLQRIRLAVRGGTVYATGLEEAHGG